jgi:hypothetical protein
MKKFIAGLFLLITVSFGQVSTVYVRSVDINSISGSMGFNIAGRGFSYHSFTWRVQLGTLSACTFTMQVSNDNILWTDASDAYDCSIGGDSALVTTAANWIRFKPSVFTTNSARVIITVNYRATPSNFSASSSSAQSYDIRNYGASCDGVTDDSAAINNADVEAFTTNGKIYVPPTATGCKINDITITSQLAEGSGPLYISNGKTLTISRPPTHLGRNLLALNVNCHDNACGTLTFSNGGTVYPEWWGFSANGSNGREKFRKISYGLTHYETVDFGPGTYVIGDSPEDETMFLISKNGITIKGAGSNVTTLSWISHAFIQGNCYGALFCTGAAPIDATYVTGLTIQGIKIVDDTNQAELTVYGFPGNSPTSLSKISNLTIKDVWFYNAGGNSALQFNCSTALSTDGSGPVLIEGVRITSDTSHELFSGINWGGCSPMTIKDNYLKAKITSGFIGGGEANRYGDLNISNNILDASISAQSATTTCIGPGGVPNDTLYIIGNTCKDFGGDSPYAIGLGNETGGAASDNSFKKVIATNNSIISAAEGPGQGFGLNQMYEVFEAIISNNHIKADYALAAATKDTGFANPGILHLDFHNNIINIGDSHNGYIAVSPASCELPAGFLWRILDNMVVGQTGSVGMRIAALNNAPCLKNINLKVAGNMFEYLQYDQYIGSHDRMSGLGAAITNGTSSTSTRTHYGALPGDLVRVLFDNNQNQYDAGVTFDAYVSAADTVTVKLTNNSGFTVNASGGAGIPTFIVERRY